MLTIVVPAYNEALVLTEFQHRLATVLDALDEDCRVLYVDDGSTDDTWARVGSLADADGRVGGLRLSRNFGKEAALSAGLDHVGDDADAVVVIDADLQDPPEFIPALVAKWREGFDVVYAVRNTRDGESMTKKFTSAAFYRVMERVSDTAIPRDTGDFRLLSRRALAALRKMPERQRFMKGLFTWIGFRQTGLGYHREPRHAGRSKWNYPRLMNLAIEGITSFSTVPLRLATLAGVIASLLAFGFGVWVLVKALVWGDAVRGYPTIMIVMLFLGGMQLLALGVIGEYLGRTYIESKQRPRYFVDDMRRPHGTGGKIDHTSASG